MIAVVIPFYQREAGILGRALESIRWQTYRGDISVVVVVDGSPIAASSELAGGRFADLRIVTVEQSNGGPAAARNAGLRAIQPGSRYVAFLDSDDEWQPQHLEHAFLALESGYDFYFSNFRQPGQTVGAFERAGRLGLHVHQPLLFSTSVFEYSGDLFDQTIRGNVIGTPTVVLRLERLGHLRFDERFACAGEDYLYWLQCASETKRIAFSTEVECICGRGVNVFSGSGWGSPRSLERIVDETAYRREIQRRFRLTDEQNAHLQSMIATSREAFALDVLHRVANRKPIGRSLVYRQLALDPSTAFRVIAVPIREVLRKVWSSLQN